MSKAGELRVKEYLSHMIEAIGRIRRYVTGLSEDGFRSDERTQDAVARNFEIIGEAAHNIERYHELFAAEHPELPWGVAYEMRNVLAHGYFQVDLRVVWKTIEEDLPKLEDQLRKLSETFEP